MTTMAENKIETTGAGESLNSIELEGGQLLALLEGVSSHAGKDKSLPVLNAVEVEGGGAYLFTRTYYGYTLREAKAQFKIALKEAK